MPAKPGEFIAQIIKVGEYKANLSTFNLLVRSFMAGLYIAVGGSLATVAATGAASIVGKGIARFVFGAVFPIGLIAILFTGMELFTGDCMVLPMAVFHKKVSWYRLVRVWILAYIGNLIGSIFWAFLMVFGPFQSYSTGGLNVNEFGNYLISIGIAKTLEAEAAGVMGFIALFLKGIGCNLLVNLAVLLNAASKDDAAKMAGIWFPIMAFVTLGLEHSIANMFFIPAAMMLGAPISVLDFIYHLVPVTLGNIIGGFVFISMVYYRSFKNEIPPE